MTIHSDTKHCPRPLSSAVTGGMNKHLLTVAEAATYVSLSASTMNRWRVSGGGPVYIKLGGQVRYDVRDLDVWIEDNKRGSTSEHPTPPETPLAGPQLHHDPHQNSKKPLE